MKILHVSHLYYPSIGGNQLHNQLMSEKLAQLNEDVTVFTAHAFKVEHFFQPDKALSQLPYEEMVNGVRVQRFDINYGLMSVLLQKKFKIRGIYRLFKALTGQTFGYWEHGPVVLRMLPAIKRLKPDFMLATNNYFFTTYLCYLAKKFYKIPLVYMPITHIAERWTYHPFAQKICNAADLVIACTEFEKKHLMRQGVVENKIKVLPIGIDSTELTDGDGQRIKQKYHLNDGPIIAYFGRKVPHKGIETLIDCMGIVWREFPNAQLLLAGQVTDYFVGTINQHINQYSEEVKKRIINIDNFEESEKKDFYAAIDIFAMPSTIDCFGIVYLEAWASAKPVIACKNTPQESIIRDGVDGLLVESEDKEELAAAILKLLRDGNLRLKMGQNGKEILSAKYNINTYGESLRREYYQLLKQQT
jgi:glycosyltransferase involved in cell wall biosynthesis